MTIKIANIKKIPLLKKKKKKKKNQKIPNTTALFFEALAKCGFVKLGPSSRKSTTYLVEEAESTTVFLTFSRRPNRTETDEEEDDISRSLYSKEETAFPIESKPVFIIGENPRWRWSAVRGRAEAPA